MTNGNEQFGPSLDLYVSPYTGRRGREAYEEDLREGRIPLPPDTPLDWLDKAVEDEEGDGGDGDGDVFGTEVTSRTRTGQQRVRLTGTFDITGSETIRQTVRRYINVPSPEEVLDDFETGISAYLGALVKNGLLGQKDAGLALTQLMPMFLSDYLADLGQRAARGEDVFRVVGLEGAPEFLGTRAGDVETTTITGQERERGRETTTTTGEETTRAQAERTERAGGETARQTLDETLTEQQRLQSVEERDITRRREETQRLLQTEELFARPNVAPVYAISPAMFMMQRYGNAGELAAVIRGRKGERARQQQTLTGAPVVAARRA